MLRIISKFTKELVKPIQIDSKEICSIQNITTETKISVNKKHLLVSCISGKNRLFKIDELNKMNSDDSNLVKEDFEESTFTPLFETALELSSGKNCLAALNKNQELCVLRYSLQKTRIVSESGNQEETYVLVDDKKKIETNKSKKVMHIKWHPKENQILIVCENQILIWRFSQEKNDYIGPLNFQYRIKNADWDHTGELLKVLTENGNIIIYNKYLVEFYNIPQSQFLYQEAIIVKEKFLLAFGSSLSNITQYKLYSLNNRVILFR